MIKVVAKLNNVRHSPFKMRVIANDVKRLTVVEAQARLALSPKKASAYILKTLNSAIANAKNNLDISVNKLKIFEIQVGEGRKIKKPKYRARGRMNITRTRYSNLRVVLASDIDAPVQKVKGKDEVKVNTKSQSDDKQEQKEMRNKDGTADMTKIKSVEKVEKNKPKKKEKSK